MPWCSTGLCRAELFDWTASYDGPKFDVLLACDVLYEDFSVDSVAQVTNSFAVCLAMHRFRSRKPRIYNPSRYHAMGTYTEAAIDVGRLLSISACCYGSIRYHSDQAV